MAGITVPLGATAEIVDGKISDAAKALGRQDGDEATPVQFVRRALRRFVNQHVRDHIQKTVGRTAYEAAIATAEDGLELDD